MLPVPQEGYLPFKTFQSIFRREDRHYLPHAIVELLHLTPQYRSITILQRQIIFDDLQLPT